MKGKFLLLVPDFESLGGVTNYYRALGLEQFDDRIEYFFVNTAESESALRMTSRLVRNYWRFWRVLSDNRYGWVIANPSLNTRSFYRDLVFCWLAFRRRRRVALFFRGWSERVEHRILHSAVPRFLFRHTFGQVRHFVVLGDSFREKLLAMGCRQDSRFWIETTVADDRYLSEFSLSDRLKPPGRWQILFMSRLVPEKGARIAVEAFRRAKRRCPQTPMTLVVAGDGPELPLLRQFVEEADIEGVQFAGAISGEERKAAFLQSDILLFPTSHDEGMPNVILEAMLYGMPVLSRRNGSIPQIVKHGVNGFLTDELDPEVFADWIVQLISTPLLYRRIAMANHQASLQFWSSSQVRARFMSILDELSNGPQGGPTRRHWADVVATSARVAAVNDQTADGCDAHRLGDPSS